MVTAFLGDLACLDAQAENYREIIIDSNGEVAWYMHTRGPLIKQHSRDRECGVGLVMSCGLREDVE